MQTFDTDSGARNTTVRSWPSVVGGYRAIAFGGVALVRQSKFFGVNFALGEIDAATRFKAADRHVFFLRQPANIA